MAEILDGMEADDDATTSLPGRRKRRIEDEPEQFFTVPDDAGQNPMAPVKRRKKAVPVQPLDVPSQLPLQPAHPDQFPPSRSVQPQTQPSESAMSHSAANARPQVQCQSQSFRANETQYQAQQSDPQARRQTQTLPDNEVRYQAHQSDPQARRQTQTLPDNEVRYQAHQPDPQARRQTQTLPDNEVRYQAHQSDPQARRQTQTFPDNEVRYQPQQPPEAQHPVPFVQIGELETHQSIRRSLSPSSGEDQLAHSSQVEPHNTVNEPELRPEMDWDQPQDEIDAQDDGHRVDDFDNEAGDQYPEESQPNNDIDNIYATPRPSRSPRLRPEGSLASFSKFIYLSAILDIDEESPSEADEAAQQALHNQAEWGDVTDLLQQHRARNRANKPPNEQRLLDAARQQLNGTCADSDKEEDDDNNDDDDNESPSPQTNLDGNRDPKALKYYSSSGVWVTAITKAKGVFRRFTMLYNLFPLRDSHLQDAATILSKVIEDLKEEDTTLVFDRRKFFYYNLFIILNLSIEYSQNCDMNIVVSHNFNLLLRL